MKVGDIVRIVKQPPDLIPKVVGEIGFIEQIIGEHASFLALQLNGDTGGGGGVLLSCLEPEPDPRWIEAKAKRDARIQKLKDDSNAFNVKLDAKKVELGHLYGITSEAVEHIYDAISKMHSDYRY